MRLNNRTISASLPKRSAVFPGVDKELRMVEQSSTPWLVVELENGELMLLWSLKLPNLMMTLDGIRDRRQDMPLHRPRSNLTSLLSSIHHPQQSQLKSTVSQPSYTEALRRCREADSIKIRHVWARWTKTRPWQPPHTNSSRSPRIQIHSNSPWSKHVVLGMLHSGHYSFD